MDNKKDKEKEKTSSDSELLQIGEEETSRKK